jgi:hypothetical protein
MSSPPSPTQPNLEEDKGPPAVKAGEDANDTGGIKGTGGVRCIFFREFP